MKLTHEIIHSAGSYGGDGFNKDQLKLLGIDWPPKQGWLRNLIGSEVTDETWTRVLALKGVRKRKDRDLILKATMSRWGHQIGDTCKACGCVIDRIGCGCNPYGA